MYCSKCGRKVENEQNICSGCGSTVNSSVFVESSEKKKYSSIGLLSAIVVVVLAFTKWIRIEKDLLLGYEEDMKFTVLNLLNKAEELYNWTEEFAPFGLAMLLAGLVFIVICLCCSIIRNFHLYSNDNSNYKYIETIEIMLNYIIILFIIVLILPWISTVDGYRIFSYGIEFWLMVGIVCANKFFVLPKYVEIINCEKKASEREKADENKSTNGKWICKNCGEENSASSYHCTVCSEKRK